MHYSLVIMAKGQTGTLSMHENPGTISADDSICSVLCAGGIHVQHHKPNEHNLLLALLSSLQDNVSVIPLNSHLKATSNENYNILAHYQQSFSANC